MLKLFQVCFFTGALYTVISFILGHLFDFAGIDAHVDGGGHIDFHIDTHFLTVSPLKPIVLASFATVFGGVGIIALQSKLFWGMALGAALLSALLVSSLLYRFVVVPLYKAQNTSAVSQRQLVGELAKATLAIKGGGYGKISYVVNGNTYNSPAKSIDGEEISLGENVVIIDIRRNTFLVKKIKGGM